MTKQVFKIEQKGEVWWSVDIEAETYEEALKLSDSSDNWESSYDVEFTDTFIVSDENGNEVYNSWNGAVGN